MHTSAHTWSLELKATIFKATQEEIQQQVGEKVQIITLKVLCEASIQRHCSSSISSFFVAVEVKVRNITKHLHLSPDVSRCDRW